MLQGKKIFIVSNEAWGDTWYSKHNYAWELSVKNEIIFINPAQPFGLFNIFNNKIIEHKIKENLTILTYKNILPVRIEFFRLINEWVVFLKLKKYNKEKNINNSIFWTFDPIRLSNPAIIRPGLLVLHMVDKYLFETKSEYLIAQRADFVLCVAEEVAEGFYPLNKNVYVVPHAIPEDEFLPLKIEYNKSISAIYVGNIDFRIDFKYQKYLIEKFPDVTFEFVGKLIIDDVETFGIFENKYKNVIWHGEKPFKELKNYIRSADFCFVFKDINHPGNNISSHKMLQYFAQGKPIFTTQMSRYEEVKDLLYMENDMHKMELLIQYFINNKEPQGLALKRVDYAKKFSFPNILKQIETKIYGE